MNPLKTNYQGSAPCSNVTDSPPKGCPGRSVAKRRSPNGMWNVYFCARHLPDQSGDAGAHDAPADQARQER